MKVGDRVTWHGFAGTVEHLSYSLATERELARVAFDSRIRITVRAIDCVPLEEVACSSSTAD
jgi:hypothetical protein